MIRDSVRSGADLDFSYGTQIDPTLNQVNFTLRSDGSAWLRGALAQNSTQTEKHDIETITDAVETLLKLRGVTYAWNETERRDIGFLAEEMAEVLPEIVGFDAEGKPTGIDYGRVTALIVEATRELHERVESQQAVIESLAERLEALERGR